MYTLTNRARLRTTVHYNTESQSRALWFAEFRASFTPDESTLPTVALASRYNSNERQWNVSNMIPTVWNCLIARRQILYSGPIFWLVQMCFIHCDVEIEVYNTVLENSAKVSTKGGGWAQTQVCFTDQRVIWYTKARRPTEVCLLCLLKQVNNMVTETTYRIYRLTQIG